MKKIILCLLIVGFTFAADLPLSSEKKELLNLQRKQILKEYHKNKNIWISPFKLSGSIYENIDISKDKSQTRNVALSWSQDIFRSAGIFHIINKAKALNQYSLLVVDLKEAAYLKNIYTLKTKIQRDKLLQKQSELTLKNNEIDLFIITQKFKVGSADISELNRANITIANAKTEIILLRNTLLNTEFELKKYIGKNSIEDIPLIDFVLINKEIYIKKNLELLQYYAKNKDNLFNSKIIQSSFHPKLTFNFSYGYTANKEDTYPINDSNGNNYYYGLTFSLPLDINKDSTINASKLVYLQSKISITDKKMELIQKYNKYFQTIIDLKEKAMIAKDTSTRYFDLKKFTFNQVKAGFKSSYELESLQNSVKIQKLEIKIQNLNILIEKISLYFDIRH